MTAALCVALAVHLALPRPAIGRLRRVTSGPARPRRRPAPEWIAAACVPVLALVLIAPWAGVVAIVAAPGVRRAVRSLETASARARIEAERQEVPGVLDLVVAALSAGRPVPEALLLATHASPGPAAYRLGAAVRRAGVELDPGTLWLPLVEDAVWAPLGRALRLASRTGMPVARILQGTAEEGRRRARAERRRQARAVGVRTAAPLGVCFLPAFFVVGIAPLVIGLVGTLLA